MSHPSDVRISEIHVVLPVHSRDAAKTRLGPALDPEERDVLVLGMLANTIKVLETWSPCHTIHLVTATVGLPALLARTFPSVAAVADPGTGLNDALRAGRDAALAAGATCLLMLPADLPLLSSASLDYLLAAADAALAAGNGRPLVAIAPAAARTGTNALLLAPADVIEPHFGQDSFAAHLRAAHDAEASVQIVDDDLLSFDLDTPDDLERLDPRRQLELERMGEELESELALSLG